MYSWFLRVPLRSFLGALLGSFMFVSAGVAQLSDRQQQFLANPGQFLAQNYTNGGNVLASLIQSIASNPANLQTVINALASSTPSQQIAIGAGLGKAATSAQQTNPSYANQIQTAVATSNSLPAATGYSSASGGTQISSTGSSAAGGTESAGSGNGGLIPGSKSTGGRGLIGTGGTSQTLNRLSSVAGGTDDKSGLSTVAGGTDDKSSLSTVAGGTDDKSGSSSLTGGVSSSVSPH